MGWGQNTSRIPSDKTGTHAKLCPDGGVNKLKVHVTSFVCASSLECGQQGMLPGDPTKRQIYGSARNAKSAPWADRSRGRGGGGGVKGDTRTSKQTD